MYKIVHIARPIAGVGVYIDLLVNNIDNKKFSLTNSVGILKIKTYRPFPSREVLNIIKKARDVAVLEKAVSLGATDGPLTLDVKSTAKNNTIAKVQGFVVGLGGRDITLKLIDKFNPIFFGKI